MTNVGWCLTKVIVTGSTGFVGSSVVERLLAAGDMQVVCLVRPGTDVTWLKTLPVEIRAVDDPAALADARIIYHVAGLTRGRTLQEYLAANAQATRRLIDAARPALARFVYVSSLAAVGPNPAEAPVDESTAPRPHDDYGRSKRAGEEIVLAAAGRLPVTIVRPPGVYGPRDANMLPVFRVARRWGFVPAIGGRDKQFSLVHVEDLADGILRAATHPAAVGQTFFLSGGSYTMEQLVAALSAALDRPLKLRAVPSLLGRLAGEWGQFRWSLTGKPQIMSRRKVRDLLQPRWTCSSEKARQMLGFHPRWSLEGGLRQTAAWYRAQGWMG